MGETSVSSSELMAPFPPNVTVSGTDIRAKEVILVMMALCLLICSVCLFFKHWKKNYRDINQLPYYAYLYQKEPPPILKPRWAAGPAPDPVAPGAGGSTMLAMASAAAAMGRPLGTTFAVYSPAPAARPFGLVRPEPRLSVSTEDYVVVDSPRSASTTPKRFLRAQSEVKFSPCSHPKQPHIRQSSLDMAETSTSPCPPLAMKSYSLTESVKHRLSRIISVDDDSTPDDVNSEEPPKNLLENTNHPEASKEDSSGNKEIVTTV